MSDDIKIVGLASPKMAPKTKIKIISSIVGVIVLAIGVIAGIFLVRQNQNINEQAACKAECPNGDNQLVNCADTPDTDGEVSLCNSAGRVEVCGQTTSTAKQYCCPAAGAAWTTNLTACSVATATPSPSPTPTSDPSLPSCGAVVPICYASTVVGTTACNDGLKTVYCCKAGQTSQNNTCTDGGVTFGGLCDPNITLRGGCATGLTCQKDTQNNYRCSSSTVTSTATATATSTGSATTKPTATATVKPTSTITSISTPVTTATAVPVPVTGSSWSTTVSVGFGVVMLLVSLGLAL